MESDDDFELLSSATVTSPVPERKLKRLKKASSSSLPKSPVIELTNPNPNPNPDPEPDVSSLQSNPDSSDLQEPSCDEPVGSLLLARENYNEIAVGAEEGGFGVKRALDFSSSAIGVVDEELRDGNEDLQRSDPAFEKDGGGLREKDEELLNLDPVAEKADDEFGEEGEGLLNSDTSVGNDNEGFMEENEEDSSTEEEESHKKRSSSSFSEEDVEDSSKKKTRKDKKKEKVRRDDNDYGDAEAHVVKQSNKRSEERKRRNHLKQLRVDSQRILRGGDVFVK